MRCPHVNFYISYITHNVTELRPRCVVAILIQPYVIIVFFYCDTLLLRINCFYTSLLPIISCYTSSLVSLFSFSRVCWCRVVCASPLFLLIFANFGNIADFAPPLTSEWGTLLWHITPFSVHCYCASRKYYYESGTLCIFKLILIYVTGNHLYCCTSLYGTSHLSLCIITARHGDFTMSLVRHVYSNLY